MLNSTFDGFNEYEQDIDEALGLDTTTESGNRFGYATVYAHKANGERIALTLKLDCHCTDLGNANRFVAMHQHVVRYCKQTEKWFIWDGRRWAVDESDVIMQYARQVAEHIEVEADYIRDADFKERIRKKEEIIKWSKTSENEHKLRAMISLAESFPELAVTANRFDSDRMLLNCLNGTLDLELFELRPHKREDYITKLAPVNYELGATFKFWDSFLERVLPDDEVRKYLQRVTGYSLTGSTAEEKLFYICGPTASGKSTFIEAIKATLGDYADTADFDAFLKRKFVGGPRNDIARLDGARFVSSIEVDEGRALAEALIKNLTGNEKITARFLHKEFFVFQPQFKLFFAANTMPRINAKDSAVWRRIDVIPFNVTIPEEEQDPKVKEWLRTPDLAGEAIFSWAVEGCQQWLTSGGLKRTGRREGHNAGIPAIDE
jgi:putative DNA primase/helicase